MSNDEPTQDPQETSAEDLTDELAKKYDPERLLRLVSKRAGRGESLEHSVRARYEKRLGVDLGHVRIYSGEFAEEFNRQRNAYAVTVGSTGMILMGNSPDKSMGSASGQALLAHELTHVAQQTRGLNRKASFGGSMPFAQEHEQEAEGVEQSVHAEESGQDAGKAGVQKMQKEQDMKEQIEKVKQRAMELAGEAAHMHNMRNGSSRRA